MGLETGTEGQAGKYFQKKFLCSQVAKSSLFRIKQDSASLKKKKKKTCPSRSPVHVTMEEAHEPYQVATLFKSKTGQTFYLKKKKN